MIEPHKQVKFFSFVLHFADISTDIPRTGLRYFWHRDTSVFIVSQCEIEVLNIIKRDILSY